MGKYHSGEIEVQVKAGVRTMAERIGNSIREQIPAALQDFLSQQVWLIVGSTSSTEQVWASVLTGQAGFVQAIDETSIRIELSQNQDELLLTNIQANPQIGLLAIEPATRRRARINGRAHFDANGNLWVETEEVFANCPKYIQARAVVVESHDTSVKTPPENGQVLTATQIAWIEQADTFFIASANPDGGADASHRGGQPGFVKVVNPGRLVFPDYSGNKMFQTLGNLALNPHSGLLFVDFQANTSLQLTGKAQVNWDKMAAEQFEGAERIVEFHIEQVIEKPLAHDLSWTFLSYSPFNPKTLA